MITSPPPPPENLGKAIFADAQCVIKSQPLHFLTLSFLFLCLPTAATVTFLSFRYPLINDAVFNLFAPEERDPHHSPNLPNTLALLLSLFIFNLVFSSLAVGSITFSLFHAFHGSQKVNLKSAIIASFQLPLLATNLLLQAITAAIAATAVAASLLLAMLLGFRDIDIYSIFMIGHFALLALTLLITYIQADWSLALTITSLKPTIWGFESMKLSKNLISMNSGKRARQIAFSTAFIVAATQASILMIICFSALILRSDQIDVSSDDSKLRNYLLESIAIRVLLTSVFLSMFQLFEIAKYTLLYVHCEASTDHHEADIHEPKYLIVPVDDEQSEVFDQRIVSVV